MHALNLISLLISLPMTLAGRLRDALVDPARRERTVLLSLGAYVLVWTVYGTIAKGMQGLHPDMTELVAWSRDLSLGYLKHPPLAAALVWAWFSIFPTAEWSYYLLAMLMPAIALWVAWRLSADYLDAEKRVAALALLMLVPFFNFHALKFNVNTVLIPLWAVTTWWFLRSFTTRSKLYAALAGLGAAGCMLGKYWSIFLLAGLFVAALIDKRRVDYFKSPAPWITVVVGAVALSPHLVWLVKNDFAPFTYAMTIHGDKSFGGTVYAALGYLLGSIGYVALPLILVLAAARPSRAALADIIWPTDPQRRLAAAAFWAPFLLPALGAVASGAEITSLWSMPAFTLLPVLLLSSPAVTLHAIDSRRLVAIAVALPLIGLVVSPAIAIMTQRPGPPPVAAQARLLALEVERIWHEMTPQPLRFVGGDGDIVLSVTTFAADKPRALLSGLTPPGAAQLRSAGRVLLCLTDDANCLRAATSAVGTATSHTVQTDIAQSVWDKMTAARRYTILVVPPRR